MYRIRPKTSLIAAWWLASAFSTTAYADDFVALNQALPTLVDASSIAPVFDFDSDGCYPSAAISRGGVQNGGLKPTGSLGGGCRSSTFLATSNTYHRYACQTSGGNTYCAHMYMLYFLKDQLVANIESGHRHDFEYAIVWTTNGTITHASYSDHADVTTSAIDALDTEDGHVKLVYHKDGVSTHCMRFADSGDTIAENAYGSWVTPTIVSWHEMTGDSVSNATLRSDFNTYDYGDANVEFNDSRFLAQLLKNPPSSYPTFTSDDVNASQ
ncbi:MAG: NPP1 family protein [Pseudomonas sp.]